MKKFEVSQEFVKAAHAAACSDWKRRIEKEIPEAFKSVFEIGRWYNAGRGCLFNYQIGRNVYGFADGVWERMSNGNWSWDDTPAIPATTEEVQEALINEAKKRGYAKGNFKTLGDFPDGCFCGWFYDDYEGRLYTAEEGEGGDVVFEKGQWATIIEEPIKKVTQAELETLVGGKFEIV